MFVHGGGTWGGLLGSFAEIGLLSVSVLVSVRERSGTFGGVGDDLATWASNPLDRV
jgi:hypothetical protein